jgi:hypothetical protein
MKRVAERRLIIDHLKFAYEGVFNASEVFNIISEFFYDRGYNWYEQLNEELITPSGKQMHMIIQPWKNASDYYRMIIKITTNMTDVKEVEVDLKNTPMKVNQGVIHMTFDGYVISDRKNKWNQKITHWFLSVIMEKYFFKEHLSKLEEWVKSDVEDLLYRIKSYLNVYKYNYNKGKIEYGTVSGKKSDY